MLEIDEPDRGLWTFHAPLSVLGAEIGSRMTVVRLKDGELLLHSPIRWTPELGCRLDELGRVRHVLAPNLDHYLFVPAWRARYPGARLYAAPGVDAKLPTERFDVVLRHPATLELDADTLTQAWFRSNHELQELTLFHRPTRTLITADLAFNIQAGTGVFSRMLLRLNDSFENFGPSRVCKLHITERGLARADLDAILALEPERLILSHGEILRADAAGSLRSAYRWLAHRGAG